MNSNTSFAGVCNSRSPVAADAIWPPIAKSRFPTTRQVYACRAVGSVEGGYQSLIAGFEHLDIAEDGSVAVTNPHRRPRRCVLMVVHPCRCAAWASCHDHARRWSRDHTLRPRRVAGDESSDVRRSDETANDHIDLSADGAGSGWLRASASACGFPSDWRRGRKTSWLPRSTLRRCLPRLHRCALRLQRLPTLFGPWHWRKSAPRVRARVVTPRRC